MIQFKHKPQSITTIQQTADFIDKEEHFDI